MSETAEALQAQIDAKASTCADLLNTLRHSPNDVDVEEAVNLIEEFPLHVSWKRSITVLLTTGGPHIELTADLDVLGR
ncbi:hypothetical protein [Nesterenkonia sp. NBAIMH1]|uniref:hypothetical protein n=1 Tax=Nesterenkonia sp. NBAIMH1 TaxID=2600320 RepID=UPI0011B7CB1D|nr:hypothetical protein [Nesterenkonia sp. NBAIMH1]